MIIDERTPNLGLPLPHAQNDMVADVERIRQSFSGLDTAFGETRLKASAAEEAAGTAREEASSAARGATRALADAAEALSTANMAASAAAEAGDTASSAAKTANDAMTLASNAASRSVMRVVTHADRGQLRAIADARQGDVAVVRGLGLFDFVPGSTEPDDDETAFAAPGGVWEVQSVSLDMAGDVLLRYIHTATWFKTVDVTSTVSTLAAGGTARVLVDGVVGVDGGERMLVVPPAEASPLLTARAWSDYWRRITLELGNPSSASLSVATGSPWRVIIMYGGA